MTEAITLNTFTRRLPLEVNNRLQGLLDPDDSWKKLISYLRMPNGDQKYSSFHIDTVEREGNKRAESSTRILLQDWGTTNARVSHLINALCQAGLYTAADYLNDEILHLGPAPRLPRPENQFPAIDLEDLPVPIAQEQMIPQPTHSDNGGLCYPLSYLSAITNNFNQHQLMQNGNLIGEGGFGKVFYGRDLKSGDELAVKKLNDVGNFNTRSHQTETELCRISHINVLPVLGFCKEECLCLVYPYMKNGSLEDRLAKKDNTPVLNIVQRLAIVKGVAAGISYLNSEKIIHRDIKSANVLLDENLVPKLGDFGIITILPEATVTSVIGTALIGTGPYMAPEAMHRTVSVKVDTFSFGVLLLEILTSLKPHDANRSDHNLVDFVFIDDFENEDDDNGEEIFNQDLLDVEAGQWSDETVQKLLHLSKRCRIQSYKRRPTIGMLLPEINSI